MVCLFCQSPTQVVNSRSQKKGQKVWRRRQCVKCGGLFSTFEQIDFPSSIVVTKSPTSHEPFSRDRLFLSIYNSLGHRPEAISDSTAITDTVINKLLLSAKNGKIDRLIIWNTILEVLHRFDPAAESHYRSYHKG